VRFRISRVITLSGAARAYKWGHVSGAAKAYKWGHVSGAARAYKWGHVSGAAKAYKWGHVPRSAGLGGASTHFTVFRHLKNEFQQKFRPKYASKFFEKKL